MNIYRSLDKAQAKLQNINLCVSIGNFDGVHSGHKYILRNFLNFAQKNQSRPLLVTFSPHPKAYIKKTKSYKILSDQQNFEAISSEGISDILVLKFDENLKTQNGADFIRGLSLKLAIKGFFLGHDFSLGSNKEFGIDEFQAEFKDDFIISIGEVYGDKSQRPSSTAIRDLLSNGNIKEVNYLLERPYSIRGKVVKGNAIGRTLGFPTANLKYSENIICPKSGVYFGRVIIDKSSYRAGVNIGVRPSVTDDIEKTIETHIIGFSGDLYGKVIDLELLEYIRDEKNFDNKDSLIKAIESDIEVIKKKPFELKFALIGRDIKHSKSPGVYYSLLKGKAISYKLLDYKSEADIPSLSELLDKYDRISVTAPYKNYCYKKSESEFMSLESVNTLKKVNGKVCSTNTDYLALKDLIKKYKIKNYSQVVLLGDGAMAKIMTLLLDEENIKFSQFSRKLKNLSDLKSSLEKTDKDTRGIIINCLSRDFKFNYSLHSDFCFWDLNYSMPEHVQHFHTMGVKYIDGIELLRLQAKYALSFWNLKTI